MSLKKFYSNLHKIVVTPCDALLQFLIQALKQDLQSNLSELRVEMFI